MHRFAQRGKTRTADAGQRSHRRLDRLVKLLDQADIDIGETAVAVPELVRILAGQLGRVGHTKLTTGSERDGFGWDLQISASASRR